MLTLCSDSHGGINTETICLSGSGIGVQCSNILYYQSARSLRLLSSIFPARTPMLNKINTRTQCTFAVLCVALFVYGCSGSNTATTEPAAPSDSPGSNAQSANADLNEMSTANESAEGADSGVQSETQAELADGSIDNSNNEAVVETGPVVDSADTPDVVADPLVQNTTTVSFDITVPAHVSNALQVQLVWNDKKIAASWVGDEFWSAVDDFPTNTEHTLVVTFSDLNGEIALGTYETEFKTGTNSSESFQITADQFDTARWDNDGDGVSNLNELIAGTDALASPRILLFSETRAYRHDSIEDALLALEELALSIGVQTDFAADSANVFTAENLANYHAVVWVLTSGDVLNNDEQAAFEQYIRTGGGYAGIHAASDTEYDWPWYGQLVGAYFERHPDIQSATQIVEDQTHSSTAHLGASWTRTDEWYDFSRNPRAEVNVLLRLDESSYSDGGMGDDHPSAWYHDFDGGRSWYTGGGHTKGSYAEPDFRTHLLGGIRYAAGIVD